MRLSTDGKDFHIAAAPNRPVVVLDLEDKVDGEKRFFCADLEPADARVIGQALLDSAAEVAARPAQPHLEAWERVSGHLAASESVLNTLRYVECSHAEREAVAALLEAQAAVRELFA